MSMLLIKGGHLLPLDDTDFLAASGDVLVENDQIVAVGTDLTVPTDRHVDQIDATGKLVMPGLVNAHLHSSENLLRGLAAGLPNELWNLRVWPPLGQSFWEPRLIYLNTLLGAMEMVRGGITTVQDQDPAWHQSPYGDAATSFVHAYTDLGMRANIVTDIVDRPWHTTIPGLLQKLPADLRAQLTDRHHADHLTVRSAADALALCKMAIQRWHGYKGLITVSVGPSALTRCSEEFLVQAGELARTQAVPFYLHLLETRLQMLDCQQRYGGNTAEYLSSIGLLGPRTSLVHATHATDADIALFAAASCTVVHSPVSNLYLGSGVMPYAHMAASGLQIAIGTDSMAATGRLSMFENMKLAATLHAVTTPDYDRWPTARQILHMATSGSARSAGLEKQIGRLIPGMKADLILLDLNKLSFTPVNNLVNQLVYSENGRSVETVIINGRVVMMNQKFTGIDEGALLEELRASLPDVQSTHQAAWTASQPLFPFVDQIYRQIWSR
jgi:cytosine/adenosine deaminase-related metal-dependent hydrolase